jgi:hypothetical protein
MKNYRMVMNDEFGRIMEEVVNNETTQIQLG